MKNSFKFFENRDCEFYPCHKGLKEINCLFCFCPLYDDEHCPGAPEIIRLQNGEEIKDCSNCAFPHLPENYDTIIRRLGGTARDRHR